MLLDLLGWEYDKDGPKSGIMASHVAVLGVDLDLTQTHRGRVVLSNTQKRVDDFLAYVAQAATSGSLTRGGCIELSDDCKADLIALDTGAPRIVDSNS